MDPDRIQNTTQSQDQAQSTPKQMVVERVREANNVLVTVKSDPNVDELASAIGLTLMLNHMGKNATAVFSGKVPSTLEFLKPDETIESNTDSLRDFIVSLDKSKADKLRYKVEDNVVKIYITPYKTTITEKDLEFNQGDFNIDVVVALGVTNRDELDKAITAHGRILHDATFITVTAGQDQTNIGQVNWQEPAAGSLSEMLVSISEAFGNGLIDEQIATAFLTGIVAETERFSNPKTTPKVMTMAAQLMAAGANQQLIANELEKTVEVPIQEPIKEAAVATAAPLSSVDKTGVLSIEHDKEDKEPDDKPQENKLPDQTATATKASGLGFDSLLSGSATDDNKPKTELESPKPPSEQERTPFLPPQPQNTETDIADILVSPSEEADRPAEMSDPSADGEPKQAEVETNPTIEPAPKLDLTSSGVQGDEVSYQTSQVSPDTSAQIPGADSTNDESVVLETINSILPPLDSDKPAETSNELDNSEEDGNQIQIDHEGNMIKASPAKPKHKVIEPLAQASSDEGGVLPPVEGAPQAALPDTPPTPPSDTLQALEQSVSSPHISQTQTAPTQAPQDQTSFDSYRLPPSNPADMPKPDVLQDSSDNMPPPPVPPPISM